MRVPRKPLAGDDVKEFIAGLESILGPDGAVAEYLDEYEYRPGQIAMASLVARSLWEGRVSIVEAGTGTGKSLAYLIPAAYWAVKQGAKVVVSTNTITLQEQLINKDVPFLHSVLDINFEVAVIKGWSNYLCLNRLLNAGHYDQMTLWEGESWEFGALLDWVKRCKTGSRSELDFALGDQLWGAVCAESDACLRNKCPYLERCFYFQERRQAFEADIIIVNHHLLFADLALKRVLGFDTTWSVLPPYRYVIWDEAHHVEDVATSYFGGSITRLGVTRLLNRLLRQRSGRHTGLLPHIKFLLESEDEVNPTHKTRILEGIDDQAIPALISAEAAAVRFFARLNQLIEIKGTASDKVLDLPPTPGAFELWEAMAPERKSFIEEITELASILADLKEKVAPMEGAIWDTAKAELGAIWNRLAGTRETAEFLTGEPDHDYVYWAALSGRQREPSLNAVPIEVAPQLRSHVFQHLQGAVLTSATLSIDGSFKYLRHRLGLDLEGDMTEKHCLQSSILEDIVESPFLYEDQVLFCIPTDMEVPRQGRYGEDLAKYIGDVLLATSGRAFVLFTSYRLLNQVHSYCQGLLQDHGILALCQGKDPRGLLLEKFRGDKASVLFGTASFWEGVDVPGETLSCVILTKLPFQVPTDPVVAARVRRLEESGQNAFTHYMLPQAVIKFKQGFGRLIRRSTDQGVVVVCDTRLLFRSYGKTFIQSIPKCRMMVAPMEETLDSIKTWLRCGDNSSLPRTYYRRSADGSEGVR
ncbi:MAG: DEAD/DEAH box helicase [Firmicutes bacterium]|nr:DEAD/DEAH box helicase [Bacillota bacterium]